MTRVFSIFERIGLGGGGKVKAVYHRMNALSEIAEFDPILLNLNHSPNQKLKFAELQANGTIASDVQNLTVPEACYQSAIDAGIQPFNDFPEFDQTSAKGHKVVYSLNGIPVFTDTVKQTPIGVITKRRVPHPDGELLYTLIEGEVHQLMRRTTKGTVETTDFVKSLPIRWFKTQDRQFVIGKNLITDTICRTQRIFGQNLFELISWDDAVVFFDGVTSAYLSPVTSVPRALFLHADHRGPEGDIVPRSKFLIENFKGEAIITSTHVHKQQIHADVTPSAEIHVIPHFCETTSVIGAPRRNLVTVSRLELTGKPIHECIEAFCQIKDEFPDIDYLIYGLGAGEQELEAQIVRLGCDDRVQLAGYTSEALNVFRHALASVYPTTTEGFGLAILEALSNGCPVISYDVNYGPREMISSGKNGELVQRGDIPAIADAMRRVLLQPEQYQRNTDHGLERYTRQTYVSNYRDFVTKLAKSGISD
ncbi:glycosyltransferase [uncultured Sulfitobacter sp.]|uniref:glycosyltransferase n=1 Tax=uncultured Sulfitobacter sp. TaxID=191468 RepID=UPI0026124C13|nr:glycosyltransferase [uncultured Sulfitobacter sp.]